MLYFLRLFKYFILFSHFRPSLFFFLVFFWTYFPLFFVFFFSRFFPLYSRFFLILYLFCFTDPTFFLTFMLSELSVHWEFFRILHWIYSKKSFNIHYFHFFHVHLFVIVFQKLFIIFSLFYIFELSLKGFLFSLSPFYFLLIFPLTLPLFVFCCFCCLHFYRFVLCFAIFFQFLVSPLFSLFFSFTRSFFYLT